MLPIEIDQACVDAEARLISRFGLKGLSVQVGSDFKAFEQFASAYDRELTEHFSVLYQAILPPRGFWMMLVAPNGEVVATVAARLDDLGEATLADHWKMILPIVYKDAVGEPVSLKERQPSFCHEASGRVVYLGEMWVHSDWRRSGIGSDFARLVQIRAFRRFYPISHLYVWMRTNEVTVEKVEQLRRDLVRVRNDKGVSQQWLADNLDVAQSSISRFESGASNGTGPLRKVLRDFELGVQPGKLAAFLRLKHPVNTAAEVASRVPVPVRTVERWLSVSPSIPSTTAMLWLIWVYGPEFLAVLLPETPSWLTEAARLEARENAIREIAELEKLLDQ
eukprot:g1617.t1